MKFFNKYIQAQSDFLQKIGEMTIKQKASMKDQEKNENFEFIKYGEVIVYFEIF